MSEEPVETGRLPWHRRLPVPAMHTQPRLFGLAVLLCLLPAVYYGIAPLLMQHIDDSPVIAMPAVDGEASKAVATAVALIEREVDQYGWTANDPFFLPTAALDNMPNFQQGLFAALGRFALEMSDQIGRARGSSQIDPDLDDAVGKLKYPGTVWVFDLETSWAPVATSEDQYRAARRALLSYNGRLAAGNAVFERRSDNLLATLDRILADIGSASALIDERIGVASFLPFDFTADDIFYGTKGRMYGYFMILSALGQDFDQVIRDKELSSVWSAMLESLKKAAELNPWVILNSGADAMLFPNHLAAQGFYLMRARTQMREVANILLK